MGKLPKFHTLLPENISELSVFLQKHEKSSILLAGGTQLIPNLKKRLYPYIDVVISLSNIKELKGIKYFKKEDTLEIGAMTTLSEIINSKYKNIAKCAKLIAAPPIQNKATIGGNICLDTRCLFYNQSYQWRMVRDVCYKADGSVCNAIKGSKRCFAVFSADLPPLLIAMDAEVEILSKEYSKTIKLKDFYTKKGKKPNILSNDEILTKVIIKDYSKKCAYYEKFRIRNAIDYPLAGVAVGFYKNSPENMNIVLNAVESYPVLIENVEFSKDKLEEIVSLIESKAHPVRNLSSTPEYRKKVCGLLFKKIIDKNFQ